MGLSWGYDDPHVAEGLAALSYFDQIMLGLPRPTCGTCRFHVPSEQPPPPNSWYEGHCHIRSVVEWPHRRSTDFCGEHKLSHAEIKRRVAEAATEKANENKPTVAAAIEGVPFA